MGGEKKPVYENGCKLNLMVWGAGALCCYKYVKVVLTCVVCGFLYITRSVSLVVMRSLRNTLECHYARVWYRWPVIVLRFSTYCVFITVRTVCLCHEGKILISWFLSTFVHL